ncbi:MAG: DUF5691 domain-containing protein [Deinococcales bacterium]
MGELIGIMLDGYQHELLPEALRLLIATGQSLPPLLLPPLLQKAYRLSDLRPLVKELLEPMGGQLAAENAYWGYGSSHLKTYPALKSLWDKETSSAKRQLLAQLRQQHSPYALSLLESTWDNENHSSRTWYLRPLEINLSLDDEPFLERALDDRHLSIRQKAAELLSMLQESRLSQRMGKALREMLNSDGDRLYLELELNPTLNRDGIILKAGDETRAKATAIEDIFAASPLNTLDGYAPSPSAFLSLVHESSDGEAMLKGLNKAVLRQKDELWARAMIDSLGLTVLTTKLVNLLSSEDIEIRLALYLDAPLGKEHPGMRMLQSWTKPWTEVMVGGVLGMLEHSQALAQENPDFNLRQALKQAIKLAPIHSLSPFHNIFSQAEQAGLVWQSLAYSLGSMLKFREKIYLALNAPLSKGEVT